MEEWKNVAGTSAGSIAACLLAAGYHAGDLDRIMTVKYRKFADYGFGGLPRGLVNSLWRRGLAPGRFFTEWLQGHLAQSPLGRTLEGREPTFADVERTDPPADLTDDAATRARPSAPGLLLEPGCLECRSAERTGETNLQGTRRTTVWLFALLGAPSTRAAASLVWVDHRLGAPQAIDWLSGRVERRVSAAGPAA